MGAMTDEVLVALLREYAAGRAEQKRLRRTARDLPRCRSVEAVTGPRCGAPYGSEDVGDHACDRCVASRPAWAAFRSRRAENKRILRILERHAAKPSKGQTPELPGPLLALMADGLTTANN